MFVFCFTSLEHQERGEHDDRPITVAIINSTSVCLSSRIMGTSRYVGDGGVAVVLATLFWKLFSVPILLSVAELAQMLYGYGEAHAPESDRVAPQGAGLLGSVAVVILVPQAWSVGDCHLAFDTGEPPLVP
jgi:hypothetical protein